MTFKNAVVGVLLVGLSAAGFGAPPKVVSLLPSNTMTLNALGVGTLCVSNFCSAPAVIARCGDSYAPDIEKILFFKPDVVLLGGTKGSNAKTRLERLGLKVAEIPEPRTVDGVFDGMVLVGAVVGKKPEAEKLAQSMRKQLRARKFKTAKDGKVPRVYILVDSGNWTAGGNSYLSDLVAHAGGANVFADLKADYAKVAWESVVERKPDVILDLSFTKTDFLKLPGADLVPALQNGRVVRPANLDQYLRPSVVIINAITDLNLRLFPAGGKVK